VKRKRYFIGTLAAIAALTVAAPAALADGGGNDGGGNAPVVNITQVASQVNTTVQQANANCTVEPGDNNQLNLVGEGCMASATNNNLNVQQICQIAANEIANAVFTCSVVVNTNHPVPGAKGDTGSNGATGATGSQGPQGSQGPPGRDGIDGLSPIMTDMPDTMTCPVGSRGGVAFIYKNSRTGVIILGPDGKPIYSGPICDGRDAVSCPNQGKLKYHTAHEISVMTGKIVVLTMNPRGQTVCVPPQQAAKWHKPKPRVIVQKHTTVKVVRITAPPLKRQGNTK